MLLIAITVIGGGLLIIASNSASTPPSAGVAAEIVDGKQIAKVAVKDGGYNPSVLTVKVGTPVELTFTGESYGCSSAIVSKDFWSGIKFVNYGKQEVVSFTPQTTGRFKYACSMGMYVGYINVI